MSQMTQAWLNSLFYTFFSSNELLYKGLLVENFLIHRMVVLLHRRKRRSPPPQSLQQHRGKGLFNTFLNNLKTPILYPGYKYLGPGNDLERQLKENIAPVNELDSYAREHDIAYSNFRDTKTRHLYDKKLEDQAWGLVKNSKKPASERVAAYITTNLIKGKRLLGMGLGSQSSSSSSSSRKTKTTKRNGGGASHRRQRVGKGLRKKQRRVKKKNSRLVGGGLSFQNAVRLAKRKFNKQHDLKVNIEQALVALKKSGKKVKLPHSRIIPLPQKGGVLPLAAILAALGTAGTVASNVSKIADMVGVLKSTKEKLFGKGLASVKLGSGLHVKPYRKGAALYFNPQKAPPTRRFT